MPKLIISRKSEWMNRFRSISIYVNGEKVGTIGNGEIEEFELTLGSTELIAKIDWCSSPAIQLNLKEEESRFLTLRGMKYGNLFFALAFLIIFLNFILDMQSYLLIAVLIPILLYQFYYLSIGRKKYLSLKEEEPAI